MILVAKIKNWIFILLILLIFYNCIAPNKKTLSKKDYLTEAIKIIQEHSIKKDSVNFDKIKRSAFEKLKNSDSIKDCHSIIKSVFLELRDNHSFLLSKEEVNKWQSTSKTTNISDLISFKGKLLDDDIGYIHLKGFSSGDSISIQKYADSLQQKIKHIDNQNLKGWILDLRENTGGNCWPMLTGLGPLLGDGICGYFIDNTGLKASWFYRNGKAGINETPIAEVSDKPYELFNRTNPIAILTGYKTASSGEVVVTAFHNKYNTKSLGTATAGLSTGNANFKLSDGSMIFLTTSIYADRKGEVFGNSIEPDVKMYFHYENIGLSNDNVIREARNWITQKNNTK